MSGVTLAVRGSQGLYMMTAPDPQKFKPGENSNSINWYEYVVFPAVLDDFSMKTKNTRLFAGFFFVQNPKTQFGILKNPDRQIFEKPSSQPKTQFQNGQKPSSPIKFFKKSAKFGKTQFQISKNPVQKL